MRVNDVTATPYPSLDFLVWIVGEQGLGVGLIFAWLKSFLVGGAVVDGSGEQTLAVVGMGPLLDGVSARLGQ